MSIVHSNIEIEQVFSVEETDYRVLEQQLRLTETPQPRELEDENKRLLE
jgi:hypothetical protein